jgi:hypothetical protein
MLLDEPDPLTRWQAISTLAGRLEWLRALTAHQLTTTGVTQRVAAAQLHVSKGRIGQLAGKTRIDPIAYTWGRALATAHALATLADADDGTAARDEATRIAHAGVTDPSVWHDLEHAVPRWITSAHRNGQTEQADLLLQRLVEQLDVAADIPDAITVDQQAAIKIGYHVETGAPPFGTDRGTGNDPQMCRR